MLKLTKSDMEILLLSEVEIQPNKFNLKQEKNIYLVQNKTK
jgi:hypothetical protein